jgi:hypothetical protein
MKKKIYLSIAVILFLSFTTHAQIEKNDWLLGGTVGFTSSSSSYNNTSYTGNSTSNASISPHIAYALGKNSTIGFNLGYNYSDNAGNNKTSSFLSNIFYKKYFPCKEKFGIYLQLYGGISLVKSSYLVLDSAGSLTRNNSTTREYDAGITPGIYYQVSKRILLTADCGGLSYIYDDSGSGYSATYWSFNFLSNFTFGVDFILGKK